MLKVISSTLNEKIRISLESPGKFSESYSLDMIHMGLMIHYEGVNIFRCCGKTLIIHWTNHPDGVFSIIFCSLVFVMLKLFKKWKKSSQFRWNTVDQSDSQSGDE